MKLSFGVAWLVHTKRPLSMFNANIASLVLISTSV